MFFRVIARTVLLRKRFFIVLLSFVFIFSSCYVLLSSPKLKFQSWTDVDQWNEITEMAHFVNFNNVEEKTRENRNNNEITDNEDVDNTTVLGAACRLPSINPWHPSVKDLIINLPKLDCGTARSRLENNTLYVEAEDAVSVSYRVISRPEGNDFDHRLSEPYMIPNSYVTQDRKMNKTISPGK